MARNDRERRMTTERALDVITIGRSSVDLYGQQIGSPARGHRLLRQVGRRLPRQHRHRHGAARPEVRRCITRVGDEQMGRFIREQLAREGVATDGIVTDPERLTALVLLAVEDEGVSPMIFFAHRLRRHGAVAKTTSTRPSSARPRAIVVTGTHFSAAEHRGRAAQGDPHRQGERRQGGLRHRLPAEPLGPRRPCRGRSSATSKSDQVSAQLQAVLARLRPDRRHRGGDHDRRPAPTTCSAALKAIRALSHGDHRAEARRDGLHRL